MSSEFFTLRPAEDKDRSFWGSAWARSWRRSRWAGCTPNHLFFDVERVKQDGLLQRGMKVLVAHVPGDPDALMGFVAYEPGVCHLVYVKDPYRRGGLATALLEASVGHQFKYTHRTEQSAFFKRPKWQVEHSPELARRKEL